MTEYLALLIELYNEFSSTPVVGLTKVDAEEMIQKFYFLLDELSSENKDLKEEVEELEVKIEELNAEIQDLEYDIDELENR